MTKVKQWLQWLQRLYFDRTKPKYVFLHDRPNFINSYNKNFGIKIKD